MHIAVLEDDDSQLALLELWLSNAGHTVRSATTAAEFQFLLSSEHFGNHPLEPKG